MEKKKRITIEMIEDFVNQNSKCKLISKEYKGYNKKIELECECGNTFSVQFNNFKYNNKRQCNECGERIKQKKFKTKMIPYNEIKNFIKKNNCTLITKENEYKGTKQKLIIQCNCGDYYKISYDKFKNQNKRMCNKCSKKLLRKKQNHKSYIDVKSFIEIKSKSNCKLVTNENNYHGKKSKIIIRCYCGNKYCTTFETFRMGSKRKCNQCTKKELYITMIKPHTQFIKEVYSIWKDEITILEEYVNSKKKILVRHNCEICNNNEYTVTPSNLLKHVGCPKCKIINLSQINRKTHDDFINEVYNLVQDEYTIMSEYKNSSEKIKVRHNNCGYEYLVTPSNFFNGKRCPKCNESKGEVRINNYLVNNNIHYILEHTFPDCKYLRHLEFDFFLPEYNTCIEYQGEQHYTPVDFAGKGEEWALQQFELNQIRDNIKKEYCKINNIGIIEIPYWDFHNIEEILQINLISQ